MKLWTIQPLEVWERLDSTGVFRCDPKKSVFLNDPASSLREPYGWMAKQMRARVGEPPAGVSYPVWAWHTRGWEHKKPDLRRKGYDEPGTECACIELEVRDGQVLLSDFDGWHFVLAGSYYDQSGSEEESIRLDSWLEGLPEADRTGIVRASWERIFDIRKVRSNWCPVGESIQATFWELRAEQVRAVQFFTAR